MKGTKMRVNEIFYSIQGEGAMTGTPAVFVRFAGCNLKCPFCDTKHEPFTEMSENEIVREINKYPAEWVIFTGGEPTLQLTRELVVRIKIDCNKSVAIETNGTRKIPEYVDWITCSPKAMYLEQRSARVVIPYADEVKIVYDGQHKVTDCGITAGRYYLQPCDTGDHVKNEQIINECINYIKKNPKWKLSLQTQKILKVR